MKIMNTIKDARSNSIVWYIKKFLFLRNGYTLGTKWPYPWDEVTLPLGQNDYTLGTKWLERSGWSDQCWGRSGSGTKWPWAKQTTTMWALVACVKTLQPQKVSGLTKWTVRRVSILLTWNLALKITDTKMLKYGRDCKVCYILWQRMLQKMKS